MSVTDSHDRFPPFSRLLREVLSERLVPNATRFIDMVSDDVVMEFPYAPANGVTVVSGRENLAKYLDELSRHVALDEAVLSSVFFLRGIDGVVVEFKGRGRGKLNGVAYTQKYISVIELFNGRIRHYRDYWNPQVFALLSNSTEDK